MPVVTASTTAQLHQHLRDAFNNQQNYEITLTGSTYTLTAANADSPSTNPDTSFPYGMAGAFRSHLPQIRTNVTIKAAANIRAKITRNTTLSATYRHFYVQQFGSLTLERLDIEKGDVGTVDTGGGAILNEGTLLLKHCRLGPANFSNYGGAILNMKGTTTLENCDIFQNEADWGGGLYNALNANMTITNCRIADNKALQSWSVGGGIANMSGALTVNHCSIFNNQANLGGGVASYGTGNAQITKSIVRKNNALSEGGGFYVRDGGTIGATCSTLTNNLAPYGPLAWRHNTGSVTISDSSLAYYNVNSATERLQVIGNTATPTNPSNPLRSRYPKFLMNIQPDKTLLPAYEYNRNAAAQYAITESRNNFDLFPFGDGNVTGTFVGTVGGLFTYPVSILDHIPGKTGSAIFVSESLHVGGLPMVYGVDGSGNVESDCNQEAGSNTSGWRVCVGDNLGASQTWKGHQYLRDYLLSNGGTLIGSMVEDSLVDPHINYTTGEILNAQALYDLFNEVGAYGAVRTGDYIFIDQGPAVGGHGFLIVGWGPAEDIQASVNAVVLGQPSGGRVSFSLDKQVNSVPYVADFAYGFDGSKTGWLQDVRPRPFYVSAANTSLSYFDPVVVGYSASDYSSRLRGNFGAFIYKDNGSCSGTDCRPDWQFYHLPDTVKVQSNRIFHYPCS